MIDSSSAISSGAGKENRADRRGLPVALGAAPDVVVEVGPDEPGAAVVLLVDVACRDRVRVRGGLGALSGCRLAFAAGVSRTMEEWGAGCSASSVLGRATELDAVGICVSSVWLSVLVSRWLRRSIEPVIRWW